MNWERHADTAVKGFERNAFFVMVDGRQVCDLTAEIDALTAVEAVFIKLVPLVGGMSSLVDSEEGFAMPERLRVLAGMQSGRLLEFFMTPHSDWAGGGGKLGKVPETVCQVP